jgi:UPF0271 protein
VLLNIDLGELPDEPEGLYEVAHLANVACGGHAGDEASMKRAIERCLRHGVRLGAHPSYPDREGFGRRRLAMATGDLRASVADQCARLARVALMLGATPAFVKAHGALYHAAREDAEVAAAVVDGCRSALGERIAFVGPASGALRDLAAKEGLTYLREGFTDRATREDGSLVPRGEPGAVVADPALAAARAAELAAGGGVDTVCVHGDTPGAEAIARAVRAALDA